MHADASWVAFVGGALNREGEGVLGGDVEGGSSGGEINGGAGDVIDRFQRGLHGGNAPATFHALHLKHNAFRQNMGDAMVRASTPTHSPGPRPSDMAVGQSLPSHCREASV